MSNHKHHSFTFDTPPYKSLADRAYIVAKGLHAQEGGLISLHDIAMSLKLTAGELWSQIKDDERFDSPDDAKHVSELHKYVKVIA